MSEDEFPSRSLEKIVVRLPDGMRDRLKAHAAANNRSVNAEVVSLLEAALWEADYARMEAGLDPLRPVTDSDREIMSLARRRKFTSSGETTVFEPIGNVHPDNERTDPSKQSSEIKGILAEFLNRLDRMEKKLDEK